MSGCDLGVKKDELSGIEKEVGDYMANAVAAAKDPAPYGLKEAHTFRVCRHIRLLARSLELPEEIVRRAAATALLHDLGRFPQYRRYNTFSDVLSRNHAALSVGVICRRGILKRLSRQEKQVILRAVVLHNRPDVPEGLDPELDLLVRLIRDADKMDIFKVMTDLYAGPDNGKASFITHERKDDGGVSADLALMVARGERLPYAVVDSLNDMKLFQLSMIYDINFPAALAHIRDQGVVPAFVRSMPADRNLSAVEAALNRYITDRIGS